MNVSFPLPPNSITVFLIVKNEAGNIRGAVDCARSFADELIVNDTGSSDGTREILTALGVDWFPSRWQDDFSLARNQCLDKANGKWAFWMDADDRVPFQTIRQIQVLKERPLDTVFGFEVVNVEGTTGLGARFMQLRMLPNRPDLRFQGRIHERIDGEAERLGLKSLYFRDEIHHFGYQDEHLKKVKARRNLALIQAEALRLMEDPMFASSLGDAWYILEEWQKGIEAYHAVRCIPGAREKNADIFHEIPCLIGIGYMKLEAWQEAIKWFLLAEQEKPLKLEPRYYNAQVLEKTGRSLEALEKYRQVIGMENPVSGTVNRFDAIHMNSYARLAQLHLEWGNPDESMRVSEEMIGRYPSVVEGHHLLGQAREKKGLLMEAVKAWLGGIRLNPSIHWPLHRDLLRTLHRMGAQDVYRESLKLAARHFPGECEILNAELQSGR